MRRRGRDREPVPAWVAGVFEPGADTGALDAALAWLREHPRQSDAFTAGIIATLGTPL